MVSISGHRWSDRKTELYSFAGTGAPGLTISQRFRNGTIGIDITLHELDEFLEASPQAAGGIATIFRPDWPVFASTAKPESDQVVLKELANRVASAHSFRAGTLDIAGSPWVVQVTRALFGTETGEVLALALPVSSIAAPVARVTRNALIVSALIIVASIPVIWMVSRGLSRPLVALAQEADRIRHFDLEAEGENTSIVDEIEQLQASMNRMRTSLGVFSQYVPKVLEQKLIERDEIPELGGSRREITVRFMDMENFTAMSAGLAPEEVMKRMSDYFEVATKILLENDATIDKNIVDAIMEIRTALDDTPEHKEFTCRAAFAMREAANVVTFRPHQCTPPSARNNQSRVGLAKKNSKQVRGKVPAP